MKTAVLLIAHGSRREAANNDLVRLAEVLQSGGQYPIIEISYLEVTEPTIPQAARRCVQSGADEVLMLPYFLSAGEHVGSDLKRHCRELSEQFPGVVFKLCPPLGLHPLIVEVVKQRLTAGHDSDEQPPCGTP